MNLFDDVDTLDAQKTPEFNEFFKYWTVVDLIPFEFFHIVENNFQNKQ